MGKKGNNLELKSVFAISYGTIIDQSQFKKWQRQVIYSFIHHSPVVSPDCLETISRAVVKSHIWKCKNKTLSSTTPPWRTQDQPAKGHARAGSGKGGRSLACALLIGSLSNNVFERRTSTGSGLFSFFDGGFAQIFSQIASITVKKLRNTNFISSRHVKRENTSLPVDVRRSKTSLLKLPIIGYGMRLPKTASLALLLSIAKIKVTDKRKQQWGQKSLGPVIYQL